MRRLMSQFEHVLWLDYETYSEADLKAVAGYNYAAHPTTEIMMAQWALGAEDTKIWDHSDSTPFPEELLRHLRDKDTLVIAFNSAFERLITRYILGIEIETYRILDLMPHMYRFSFSGGLAAVGAQVGLSEDQAKLKRGSRLIQKFCKPAAKNHKADRYTRETSPEEWEEFRQYAIRDIDTMRHIARRVYHLELLPFEHDLWVLDQTINDRGLPIDVELASAAIYVDSVERERLMTELVEVTGLGNPNSVMQLRKWLEDKNSPIESLAKVDVKRMLDEQREAVSSAEKYPVAGEEAELADRKLVVTALELRSVLSKTSVKKYHALERATIEDRRVLCGAFQLNGASRTNRWSGRKFQPHNLARPSIAIDDDTPAALLTRDVNFIRTVWGDVTQNLSDHVRSTIMAPEGKMLVSRDLSGVESIGLAWYCGAEVMLDTFAKGLDSYKVQAMAIYDVAYDDVTPDQRRDSKPTVLGCGYGMGWRRLKAYARDMGTELVDDVAKHHVDSFRDMHHEIPACWYWLADKVASVIKEGREVIGYRTKIHRDSDFLKIVLPSGRTLYYHKPEVVDQVPPWGGKPKPTISYMGTNAFTGKWDRITTHGGKIVENIIQALTRDAFAYFMVEADKAGLYIVGHVHDDLILMEDEDKADAAYEKLGEIMATPIPWLPGFAMKSEGYVAKRFRK